MAGLSSNEMFTEPYDDYEAYDVEEEKQEEELLDHFKNIFKELLEEIRSKWTTRQNQEQAMTTGTEQNVHLDKNMSASPLLLELLKKERQNPVAEGQMKIARDFFDTKICPNPKDERWTKFKYFDFHIIVPKFLSLGKLRSKCFIFFN